MKGGKFTRKSIRLKDYDYSQAGMYFVTICAKNRECLFGEIRNEKMVLNELGMIAQKCWEEIIVHHPNVELDEYIIMPNHLHGIIFIVDDCVNNVGATLAVAQMRAGASPATMSVAQMRAGASPATMSVAQMRAGASPAPTVGNIIGSFKSISTNQWLKYIKQNNFNLIGKFWQRNYYEHIIRNENSLEKIRNYIYNNPGGWPNDIENSAVNKNITGSQSGNYYKKIF